MIRRNRKKRRNDGFIFPAPFSGTVVMLLILGLTYVWLECRCQFLGREIAELERQQAALEKSLASEEYRWTQMKSLPNVERELERHGIIMGWPERGQVRRLRAEEVYGDLWEDATDKRHYAKLEKNNRGQ